MTHSAKTLAIVYHSPYGHTAKVARAIAQGVQAEGVMPYVMSIDEVNWDVLDAAQAIVFGCPTYMGSVTADYKKFMDSSSKRWINRTWQNKLAAGFTNSGGLSGDKLSVLQQIQLFAMQHGMLWSGLPLMPTGRSETDLNRLSSFMGLMTQSDNAPVEITPPQGDLDTAIWFGRHLAKIVLSRQEMH